MPTCGEVLVEILENYGIDTLFGIPGVHTVELYRGLENARIRHVTPRHEQAAGFMADGYARASGKIAACFIISGPGMTNIATAMGQALADSIPMLVISSVNRTHELGLGEGRLHEMTGQRALVAGVARFSHTLIRADELPKVLARAFATFKSERPGPVHIEIPIDVITAPAGHLDTQAFALPSAPAPSPHAINASARLLKAAERPVIVIGGGAINAAADVVKLAEKLGAPVMNTVNAKGVLPYSHPLAVGGSASCAALRDELKSADAVVAVGTEMGETDYDFFFAGPLQINGKLIRIDIDAAQLTRNVRADVAICSDARYALQALNQALSKQIGETHESRARNGAARAKRIRDQLQATRDPDYENFFAAIREALPDVIIAGDSTQPTYYAWLHYETEKPRRYFHSASGFGTLGYAIPAAIGAKLAAPHSPVIGLIGDGAAQFTIGELASAVDAKVAVIFLIWNNTGYGEIKRFMADRNIPQIGVDIYTPDFVGLGKAFGCHAVRASNLHQLKSELVTAAGQARPTVIEVMQDKFAAGYPAL
ncbi:5-guanidino-2-oxopentanoate decarboxylase [Candidatus Spongiihabitans sp.]|uniref:5-guanidino-2-oxopentanoate decarboxylase n=1 Tax=Candidatus Spongiihabitans sp. TaxID=3101308 RepID=UPI003C7A38D0